MTTNEKANYRYLEFKVAHIQNEFSEIFMLFEKYQDLFIESFEHNDRSIVAWINYLRKAQNCLNEIEWRFEAKKRNKKFKWQANMSDVKKIFFRNKEL